MSDMRRPSRRRRQTESGAAKKRWERDVLIPHRARHPERQPAFATQSGLPLDPLFTAADHPLIENDFPGVFPYTRGIQPTMYRGRLWTMRQYAGYATADESNRRYHYLLAQGQTGLSVAFDLPTQMGYDADHPFATSEVGRVGVSICSLEDMETLLAGLPLDRVSTSMTINATAPILLAMYVVAARRQGVAEAQIAGTVQNDILKEYIARGTFIYPPEHSIRLAIDVIDYCATHVPKWYPISISGYHIREAGATAVQELAFTLANGLTYVQAACDRGLAVDDFAPRLSFFFNAHNDLFEEIAKFRAARRLWAHLMSERFGARDPRATQLRFHAQTAGCTLTAQQPENNIVRTTLQGLAAVLGGCQSLHTNALDEALALPSEKSARIALRTQQIIAFESGVTNTVDPLGGSYLVETLTDRIEAEALSYLRQIDLMGGAIGALKAGFFQREIGESAYRYQKRVEAGDDVVVGVNRFGDDSAGSIDVLQVDPATSRNQAERLTILRQRRDPIAVQSALGELQEAARGPANLMPSIIRCVESWCTLGEISDALRRVFGEYRDPVSV